MKEKMKIVKLLATQSGTSQQTGKPWKSREVVVESVQNAMHPDQYVAVVFFFSFSDILIIVYDF